MKGLEFYKMNATGNDFVVIDNRDGRLYMCFADISDFVVKVCRRHEGVGADGLILIERAEDADFSFRFFNCNGSEAEMCGNGGRCAARFASLKGIAKAKMSFRTLAGIIRAEVRGRNVKLQMTDPFDLRLDYPIDLGEKEIFLSSVNTGVPHAVIVVDDIEHAPVEELGRQIRYHKAFGEKGTNVNFVKVVDRKSVIVRTYERGVERETLACGTGAVAVAYSLKAKGMIETPLNIHVRSGEVLMVHLEDGVFLEGATTLVYTGVLHKEALL